MGDAVGASAFGTNKHGTTEDPIGTVEVTYV